MDINFENYKTVTQSIFNCYSLRYENRKYQYFYIYTYTYEYEFCIDKLFVSVFTSYANNLDY